MIPKLAGKRYSMGVYYFEIYWFRVGLIPALALLAVFLSPQSVEVKDPTATDLSAPEALTVEKVPVVQKRRAIRGLEWRLQQECIELQRLFDAGSAMASKKDYEGAILKFEQVLERIKWSPYNIDFGGLEEKARKQIIESRKLKRAQDLEDREQRERSELSSGRGTIQSLKKQIVHLLLKRALDELRLNQFAKAEETVREVIAFDADNQTARRLQQAAVNGRHVHYGSKISTDDREEFRRNEEINRENCGVPYLQSVIFPDKEKE